MDIKFAELKKQFVYSHYPVGIALSGGLDSAVVLHELCKVNPPGRIYAYSMKWGNGKLSHEANAAARIAKPYGVHFKAIKFDAALYWSALDLCMEFFDRPRWNIWPFMILKEANADGVKDFYIGEGCDELFGYQDRSYLQGWSGQLEYIQPVWKQIGKHFSIVIHCPFFELEKSFLGTGLPTTLHWYCGKIKQDLWDTYKDQLKGIPIWPKIVKTPEYYGILKKTKEQLLVEVTKIWLRHNT